MKNDLFESRLFDVYRDGFNNYHVELKPFGINNKFLRFLVNVSTFRKDNPFPVYYTLKEDRSLLAKLLSVGYIFTHNYSHFLENQTNIPVVVCDEKNNRRGRTGKSLFVQFIKPYLNTCIKISEDGFNLEDWDNLQDDTRLIIFCDLKPKANFKELHSFMSLDLIGKRQLQSDVYIPAYRFPRVLVTTSHYKKSCLGGKVMQLTFSDFYGLDRVPYEDFGKLRFTDNDASMIEIIDICKKLYLKFGLINEI